MVQPHHLRIKKKNHTTSPKLFRPITQEHTDTTHKALEDFNAHELTRNHTIQLKSILNTKISRTGITVEVAVEDDRAVVASAIVPLEAELGVRDRGRGSPRWRQHWDKVAESGWLS